LGLAEAADGAHYLARRQIDHAHAVIAELRDEQPPTRQVDTQVIDPAAYLAERDFRL